MHITKLGYNGKANVPTLSVLSGFFTPLAIIIPHYLLKVLRLAESSPFETTAFMIDFAISDCKCKGVKMLEKSARHRAQK